MMFKIRVILSSIVTVGFLFLNSCKVDDKNSELKSTFDLYLQDNFPDFSPPNEAIYYIITANSCEPCLMLNINMLINFNDSKKIIPVLSGEPKNQEIKTLFMTFASKYDVKLIDNEMKLYNYEIDFSKPMLMHTKNGELIYSKNIGDFEIETAESYLLKHAY